MKGSREQYEKFIHEGKEGFVKKIEQVDAMTQLVERARDGWLAEAVELRDTISHYAAAKNFLFKPVMTDNGIDAGRPRFTHHGKTVDPVRFLESVYSALQEFAQDFMCRALHIRMRWPVDLRPVEASQAVPVAGPYAHFVKWGWKMNGADMVGMFNTGS